MEKLHALFECFLEYMVKFSELKVIIALRDGFVLTLPLTLAGSVFLLIANVPIEGYADFMASIFGSNWDVPLKQVSGATYDVLALLVVVGVSYKFAQNEGCDAIMSSLFSLGSFLVVTKSWLLTPGGEIVRGAIEKNWIGGNGVITAILIALSTSYIFCFFTKRGIIIKMPDGVPDNVGKAFAALIPGLVIFTLSALLYIACDYFANMTFTEVIFSLLQTPLQNMSASVGGGIVCSFIICILFWAGIHGPNVVGGVMNPIWIANSMDNQKLIDAGMSLIGNEQAKIITMQVQDVFIKLGGCGMTIGLLIAMLIVARSTQIKQLSRLAFFPGLFNINEPLIFGLPIVFNPYLIVPFIGVPIIGIVIIYIAMSIGFLSPFNAVQVPWTTPPIISGLLIGGWQGAVVQILLIIMSAAVYLPFIKIQDQAILKEERAEAEATTENTSSAAL